MRYLLAVSVLLAIGCAPDFTRDFQGKWAVTSGTNTDRCPGSVANTWQSKPGDITLEITTVDNAAMNIRTVLLGPGTDRGTCDLSAIATNETTATLDAKACRIGASPFNFVEGSLRLSASRSMTFDFYAEYENTAMGGSCTETSSNTLVPQ